MRKILAVDPGFAALGYAVVGYEDGEDEVLDMGVIRTEPTKHKGLLKSEDTFRRMREIARTLIALIDVHKVDGIALESLSLPQQTSKQNAVRIGQPYALLAALAEKYDLPAVMLSPQTVKKAVCGRSNASKQEVQEAIEGRFASDKGVQYFERAVPKSMRDHGWDALAVYVAASHTEVMRALKRGA